MLNRRNSNNKLSCSAYLFSLVLIAGIALAGNVSAAEKLKLNTGTLAPYTTEDKQGFLDQVVFELFRRIGHEAEVVVYGASARALANANNAVDAGAAMRIKGLEKKYPNLIRVPEKLIDNDFVAYSKGLELATTNWDSVTPYSVGYILGWQIFERNLSEEIEREKVADPNQLFFLLDKNRVDLALYERWQGLWRAKEQGVDVVVHEPPLAQREMFIYLHKNYAHLVDKAAEALAQMKKDGAYQAIVDRTLTPLIKSNVITLGEIEGVAINPISKTVLTEAYRRIGMKLEFKAFPGKRSLEESNSGRIDGEIFRIKGMEKHYPNLLMVPIPVNKLSGMVFTKNRSIKVDGWQSLRGYKAGVRRGIQWAENGTQNFVRRVSDSYEELFELLDKGIVDYLLFDRVAGTISAKKYNVTGIEIMEPPLEQKYLYHYLNQERQELIPKLTLVLDEMAREGYMKKVRQKFIQDIAQ